MHGTGTVTGWDNELGGGYSLSTSAPGRGWSSFRKAGLGPTCTALSSETHPQHSHTKHAWVCMLWGQETPAAWALRPHQLPSSTWPRPYPDRKLKGTSSSRLWLPSSWSRGAGWLLCPEPGGPQLPLSALPRARNKAAAWAQGVRCSRPSSSSWVSGGTGWLFSGLEQKPGGTLSSERLVLTKGTGRLTSLARISSEQCSGLFHVSWADGQNELRAWDLEISRTSVS